MGYNRQGNVKNQNDPEKTMIYATRFTTNTSSRYAAIESTNYLTTNDPTNPANFVTHRCYVPMGAAIASRMSIIADEAPGASESITAILRVNGADVGDPVILENTDTYTGVQNLNINLAEGDLVCLRSIASAGAITPGICVMLDIVRVG